MKMPWEISGLDLKISRVWNAYLKMPIRDVKMRLQGVTGLERSIRDISVRLQDLPGLEH